MVVEWVDVVVDEDRVAGKLWGCWVDEENDQFGGGRTNVSCVGREGREGTGWTGV